MSVTRRTVTVLFADVADSTPLGERLDPEALRQVMGEYFETSRAVLERHGGTVEKFIGDAVMAVFGVPKLHEDDPVRAVRAAAELQHALDRLNDELEQRRGVRLGVRIGINTGEVVAALGPSSDHLVTGDTVNVAKRLEQAALAGQVLVGAATERLSRGKVTYELVEPVAAKGKSVLIEAWRLVDAVPDGSADEQRLETPFVGRRRELDELRRAFDDAVAERSCRRVTLLGPAGIGKSRLATEFCEELGDAATILSGRCLAYGDGLTFWPVVEMIRQLGGAESVHRFLAPLPDGQLAAQRLAAVSGDAVEQETPETFWAVRMLFEALARTAPLLVRLEDLHWAQPTLLDLLEYLVGWTRDAPILLLCLARPEFVEERPTWLGDGSLALTVPPLTSAESERLLDSLGTSGSGRVRIAEAAEGNPLYVEQIAAMIAEGGYEEGLFEIPPSIQALLAARLDRLTPPERAAIERAAVAGKEFALAAVVELTPAEARADVGRCLLSLVRKGLIRPHRSTLIRDDAFRFGHVLIRDAAYAGLPKELRAELHASFADWLESGTTTSEFEEIVGYHLERAYRCHEEIGASTVDHDRLRARARDALSLAGRRAAERGDAPAAANLLGRAVDLTLEGEPMRVQLMIRLGVSLRGTGRLVDAQRLLDEARATATEVGDRNAAARATLESAIAQLYTWGGRLDEFIPKLDTALAELEDAADDDGISRALTLHAQLAFIRCRMAETQALLERALRHAGRAGNERQVCEILGWLGRTALRGPQRVSVAKARCEVARNANPGDRALEAALDSQLALLEAMQGRFEAARVLSARSRETFHDLGRLFHLAVADAEAGMVDLLAGDFPSAEGSLRAACDALESIGERGALSTTAALLAAALYEQNADEDAAHYCAVSAESSLVEDVLSQVLWRSVQAKLVCRRDAVEEGEQLAREAVALARETDDLNLAADALTSLGIVLTASGSADGAADAYLEAIALYERKENVAAAARTRDRAAATEV